MLRWKTKDFLYVLGIKVQYHKINRQKTKSRDREAIKLGSNVYERLYIWYTIVGEYQKKLVVNNLIWLVNVIHGIFF